MIEKFLKLEQEIASSWKIKAGVFGLFFILLLMWSGYTSFFQPKFHMNTFGTFSFERFLAQALSLLIMVGVFWSLYRNRINKTTVLALGAIAILMVGSIVGFYDAFAAAEAVNINTIALLFGMGVISLILVESNVLHRLCHAFIHKFGQSVFLLFLILTLLTYSLSLVINNLTTILLIVPLTLSITRVLKLNSIPFVVGEIIASNLGGASSMVGDFPNMIIATSMHIPFHHFIRYLMPICLINLGIMLAYFYYKVDFKSAAEGDTKLDIVLPDDIPLHHQSLKWTGGILIIMIGLFIWGILPPGLVALVGAALAFFGSGLKKEDLVEKIRYDDAVFFIVLFIFVGGIKASGLLQTVVHTSFLVSGKLAIVQCLLLMWLACIFTLFLNAGPSAALFLPIFIGIQGGLHHELVFWALSLGICAGSSGSLTGATAGPVASNLVEQVNQENKEKEADMFLSFKNYLPFGLPVAYLHLLTGTIYITLLYVYGG